MTDLVSGQIPSSQQGLSTVDVENALRAIWQDLQNLSTLDISLGKNNDYTWTGQHEFQSTACFSAVDISDSLDLTGALACGSTATITNLLTCFSSAIIPTITNLLTCSSAVTVTNVLTCSSGFVCDGTAVFTTNIDISGDCDISGGLNVSGDISMVDISGTVKQRFATTWCSFCGNAGATLVGSYNVSSVQRAAAGDYSITFTNAYPDVNYAVFPSIQDVSATAIGNASCSACVSKTTTGCRIQTNLNAGLQDISRVSVLIFGT